MHAFNVRDARGQQLERLVLRRYVGGHRHSDAPSARREYRTLALLEEHGVDAPKPVWLDADGARFGAPAMVISRLPGMPRMRAEGDPAGWLAGLAQPLVSIHEIAPTNADLSHLETTTPATMRAELVRGLRTDLAGNERGERIFRTLSERMHEIDAGAPTLVHDDYFPANVLWYRGRVSGVVDWQTAEIGDRRTDVAQLQLDLALMHGPDLAQSFEDAYLTAGGRMAPQLWFFQLFRGYRALATYQTWLAGYHDLGLSEITPAVAGVRLAAFLDAATERAAA